MQKVEQYRAHFLNYLKKLSFQKEPISLYNPIDYILNLGGKRLRPVLTLMTAEIFDQDYKKALNAALAIEVFHNFSLVHDDIMDEAPLRRGRATVHKKWNLNTGILSGDAMLIMAYQLFENYEPNTFIDLAKLFSKTALEVCEGQQYDIDFETKTDVTVPQYIKMIEYKTAVLVGAAMKMGAIVANVDKQNQQLIYDFGKNLGIAFQLQDDYLDAFGNPETFGKLVGGDIIENKKTYLYIKALEIATTSQKEQLINLFSNQKENQEDKIEIVKELFKKTNAINATKLAIKEYTNKAFETLERINISKNKQTLLYEFGKELMSRKS